MHSLRRLLALFLLALAACAPSSTVDFPDTGPVSTATFPDPTADDAALPSSDPADASAFAPPPDQDAGVDAGDPPDPGDASPPMASGPPFDAGPGGVCPTPPGPGDLSIVELMIETVAGTGDHGQWLEVQSNRDCALDLYGLRGECPNGAKVRTFEVATDVWLPARSTFVVADSTDPALNRYLPGMIVGWDGNPGDVLRHDGTTVTLFTQGVVVDTLTYPKMTLVVGASLAFPKGCAPELRTDFGQWQWSTATWFPGFFGTPNAPNTDVRCP
jgi:hypothetical protein